MLPQPRHALRDGRPRLPLRLCRVLALLLAAALLSACSARVFFYNRLDFLIPWYIEGYVPLDRDQEDRLEALLDPVLAWHRREELPRYAALVDEVRRLTAADPALPDVTELAADIEVAWYRLRDRALEALLGLAETLTEAQVEAFIAELRERQAEYEAEYLPRTDEEYREDALERLEDSLGDYLGRLDDGQEQRLAVAVAELERIDGEWLAVRAAWIERLEEILAKEPGWQERLRASVRDWAEWVPESYIAGTNHNSAVVLSAVTDVLAQRSERQQARLERELAALERDLGKLMVPAVPSDTRAP
ncbi:DUF6279 family lipoprotein [Pseudohaliea sp.]|uniref:DUF6279 family lipoprotein n=1 Tax=Pseudohaliea sp. TaxID=2740289 RepID=UPI0032ECF233